MIQNSRNIPVLILGYNRPDHIKKLIKILSKIKPTKIYVSLDGPKKNTKDKVNTKLVKNEIQMINWNCFIKKKYNNTNLGCRVSVRKGIDWFFKYNNFGIILEDDCLPNKSFFDFCFKMNLIYKNKKKIFSISGSNFYNKNINYDYFYTKYNHCWGWATWRRAWKNYDDKLIYWTKLKNSKNWKSLHKNSIERRYWEKIIENVKKRKIDSWAYVWTYSMWYHDGITVVPKKNLIKNIGFDIHATNSIEEETKHLKNYRLNFKKKLISPDKFVPLIENDDYVFKNHFKGKSYLWPWVFLKITKLAINNPKIFIKKINKYFLNFVKI